jgi:hypothetical protein
LGSYENHHKRYLKGEVSMAKRKQTPAKTPEARENQLVNLAVEETERRLLNGTASSQIITTLLKLATTKAQLELEKLRSDIALQAKEQEIADKASNSDLYVKALAAFRSYKGDFKGDEDDDDEDDYL